LPSTIYDEGIPGEPRTIIASAMLQILHHRAAHPREIVTARPIDRLIEALALRT
jgi:hypothetical protein